MTSRRLNFAGFLAKHFITSKLTLVFIIAVALMGVVAVLQTPREENPQIIVPAAAVMVGLPGASASEVESLVVTPLEGILSELPGVDHIESTSRNSQGIVQVQFKVGESKEQSLVKLYDRVMASRAWLPADATTPLVQSVDADDVPIVTFTLASSKYDDYALNRMAERMAERLRSTENVSVVSLRGGQHREITIELEPDRLQAYGVTLGQARAAFPTSNLTLPLPPTVRDGQVQAIKLDAAYTSAEDVRNQLIAVRDKRPVYVRDVATVTDGPPSEPTTASRLSFGLGDPRFGTADATDLPAVTIAVAKKKGTNAVVVANAVIDRMQRMQATFVPQDIQVVVTRNDGQKADDAVNLLLEHLTIALVTVGLVLILFLGWREALIVMITVPLIMGITLTANLLGGVTINRVTLFALILALGLLVDAAIVVIENIHRHYASRKPKADKEAETVLATNEIGNATNLATFAVMLVFITLLLALTGMPRQYFFPVAVTVPVAMAASIVVAYIVVPWASNRWLHRHDIRQEESAHGQQSHGHGAPGRIERLYLRLFSPLQQYRNVRIGFALAVLLLMTVSLMQGAWQFVRPAGVGGAVSALGVPIGFLPKDDQNTFNVVVSMPETTPVEDTDRLVRQITTVLAQEPHVLNYQTWVGQAGVADFNGLFKGTSVRAGNHVAEIRVNLIDKRHRKESSIDIVRELRPKVETIRAAWPGRRGSARTVGPGTRGLRTDLRHRRYHRYRAGRRAGAPHRAGQGQGRALRRLDCADCRGAGAGLRRHHPRPRPPAGRETAGASQGLRAAPLRGRSRPARPGIRGQRCRPARAAGGVGQSGPRIGRSPHPAPRQREGHLRRRGTVGLGAAVRRARPAAALARHHRAGRTSAAHRQPALQGGRTRHHRRLPVAVGRRDTHDAGRVPGSLPLPQRRPAHHLFRAGRLLPLVHRSAGGHVGRAARHHRHLSWALASRHGFLRDIHGRHHRAGGGGDPQLAADHRLHPGQHQARHAAGGCRTRGRRGASAADPADDAGDHLRLGHHGDRPSLRGLSRLADLRHAGLDCADRVRRAAAL
ncbi:efflux RND transporter permease subunit [Shewanella chilikensis]|nr:efflux RND transporter permease subunit [Shewanella chilikensis]MCL1162808.1 efflux RND transporter permease subunit [Shewanella chilikensis]